CHIEPKGSRTGNPFGDHVFLGARTAVAYKTKSWGACGRHLSLGTSSKVAIDGPFEAVLGETRSSLEPAGRPFPTRLLTVSEPGLILPESACRWPQVFHTQAIRLRPMTLFNPVFNARRL